MEDRGLYQYARTARESRKVREALRSLNVYTAVEAHAAVEADLTDIAAMVLDLLHDPLAETFRRRAETMREALENTTARFSRPERRGHKPDREAKLLGPVLQSDRPLKKKRA